MDTGELVFFGLKRRFRGGRFGRYTLASGQGKRTSAGSGSDFLSPKFDAFPGTGNRRSFDFVGRKNRAQLRSG